MNCERCGHMGDRHLYGPPGCLGADGVICGCLKHVGPKCDMEYAATEDTNGLCCRELGHEGDCGRND